MCPSRKLDAQVLFGNDYAVFVGINELAGPEVDTIEPDRDIQVAFASLVRPGRVAVEGQNAEVAERYRRVLLRNVVPFFRRDIYLDSLKLRELVQ